MTDNPASTDATRFLPVDLSGRRVLVTAGADGIGRVIAEGFLQAGARVHVCDISEQALGAVRAELPAISASRTDVSDAKAIGVLFDEVEALFGGLDILVNNAGIAGPTASITDVETEALRATLAIDVEAMFHCAKRAVPLMKAAGGGDIVNLSSVAGRLAFPMRTPYATAKWGVVGFTKSLAFELGRENIRVNAILPGHVNAPRFYGVVERRAATLGITPAEMKERILEPVALGRMVDREDIANMALYLCSPFGRAISGQAISVCGGVEMMK